MFDEVVKKDDKEYYGIKNGKETIVFLKPGNGGSYHGYEGKYVKLAKEIYEKHGYTIIVSSNPFEEKKTIEQDFEFIKEYIEKRKWKDYTLYLIGVSDGGRSIAREGYLYPNVKRMLLINAPLFIDFNRNLNGLFSFKGEKICLAYSSLDPTYNITIFAKDMIKKNPAISFKILEGQDHLLSKNNFNLFELVEETLLS